MVIVVDLGDLEDHMVQSLMYVGMSRARALLILVAQEEPRRSIDARIKVARTVGKPVMTAEEACQKLLD